MRITTRVAAYACTFAVCTMLTPAAYAEERGTMDLAPGAQIARVMSEEELAKQRGGFMGLAFSATFTATVENMNGNVTGNGTATSGTTGVTSNSPPVNYSIQGGTVQLSSFIGNMQGLNGVFQLTSVNGIGNCDRDMFNGTEDQLRALWQTTTT